MCQCQSRSPCCLFYCGDRASLYTLKIVSTLSGGLRFHDNHHSCTHFQSIAAQVFSFFLQILLSRLLYGAVSDSSQLYVPLVSFSGLYATAALFYSLLAYFLASRPLKYEKCLAALPEIKSGCNVIFAVILAGLTGCSMAYLVQDRPFLGQSLLLLTPMYANCFFGKPPEQSALYDYENDHIGFYSMKYSRPIYLIILALIRALTAPFYFLEIAHLLPAIFTLGWLSSPAVTFFYLLEQINIFVFGSTARVHDLRVVLSFIFSLILGSLTYAFALLLADFEKSSPDQSFWNMLIMITILSFFSAYFSSLNILSTLGIKEGIKFCNAKNKREKALSKKKKRHLEQDPNSSVQVAFSNRPQAGQSMPSQEAVSAEPSALIDSADSSKSLNSSIPIYKTDKASERIKLRLCHDTPILLVAPLIIGVLFYSANFYNETDPDSLKLFILAALCPIIALLWFLSQFLIAREELVICSHCRSSCYKSKKVKHCKVYWLKFFQQLVLLAAFSLLSIFHFCKYN